MSTDAPLDASPIGEAIETLLLMINPLGRPGEKAKPDRLFISDERSKTNKVVADARAIVGHLIWGLEEARRLAEVDSTSAHIALSFAEGAMWALGLVSLDQLTAIHGRSHVA